MDDVRQRVTVKLIPRIDLQALANKLVKSLSCFLTFFVYSLLIKLRQCFLYVWEGKKFLIHWL